MVAFVDLKECDKIDFREQQEWWGEMLPDCITGVRVWEYDNTMTDPDPRKLNTDMFQFDQAQSRWTFVLDQEEDPDLRLAVRKTLCGAQAAEVKLADLQLPVFQKEISQTTFKIFHALIDSTIFFTVGIT